MIFSAKQRIHYFILVLTAVTIVANYAASSLDQNIASLIIMWSPAVTAFAVSIATKRSLKDIGWRLGKMKWLAAGWMIPILYASCAYGIVWLLNLGSVPNPVFLERARLTLSMPDQPNWLVIVSAFGFITIVNLIPAMVVSLGEEIGWRGFLVPELTQWIGFKKASFVSGLIWAAWHMPGIITGQYGSTGTPMLYQLSCFVVMVVATGIIMAWLRMKSGSIWTVAIMHATHNGVVQTFYDRITADTGYTKYFIGEFGIALIPFVVALAWYFWKRSSGVMTTN